MRLLLWLYRLLAALVSLALLGLNLRLYHPGGAAYRAPALGPDTVAQLHGLRAALEAGAGADMQQLFPEGYFFSYALYGLTWVEVGRRAAPETALHAEALREARWAWSRVDAPAGRAVFSPQLTPPYGVFYAGWSTWLLGGLLTLQPESERNPLEVELFEQACAELAAAFDASATPFLPAYPGQAWPVDSVVAMAALSLHDRLFTPAYAPTVDRWVRAAQALVDPDTGLLPHQVQARTGQKLQGTRGSSQSVIARFLIEIDPAWGRQQYAAFREQFLAPVLGVPGTREYPLGRNGAGDVDSGPLVAGFSASATVVTLGAAQVHGDAAVVDALIPASEAVGLPVSWGGQKRYAFGVLPVGEAFLAWSKNASAWTAAPEPSPLPGLVDAHWRWPFHLAALALAALAWAPEAVRARLKAR